MSTVTFQSLQEMLREISALGSARALLNWDREVFEPSAEAAKSRAAVIASLAGFAHDARTSTRLGDMLQELSESRDLSPKQMFAVETELAGFERRELLPKDLVVAHQEATILADTAWKAATKAGDATDLLPHLDTIVKLQIEQLLCMAESVEVEDPYDLLLHDYCPGLTVSAIDPVFRQLRDFLVGHVPKAVEEYTPLLDDDFNSVLRPVGHQNLLAVLDKLAQTLGFRGRIDEVKHPFMTGIHPHDVRITMRTTHGLIDALDSVTHETGHALYDQGCSSDWFGFMVGDARSMSIHESQSRLMEVFLGSRRSFNEFLLRSLYGDPVTERQISTLQEHRNTVVARTPRLLASQLTYPMHIILRYELEREIFAGKLEVRHLRDAWNAKSQELLGFTPENDVEGFINDCHWASGYFGYFPTYTLGDCLAAEVQKRLERSFPDLDEKIVRGDFEQIVEWLRLNIHQHGSFHSFSEVFQSIAGKAPDAAALIEHLRTRYAC